MSSPESFDIFMKQHANLVFTTAARITGNDMDAQDIAQEVFVLASQKWETMDSIHCVEAWLRTLTRRKALNHFYRYQKRWSFFSDATSLN